MSRSDEAAAAEAAIERLAAAERARMTDMAAESLRKVAAFKAARRAAQETDAVHARPVCTRCDAPTVDTDEMVPSGERPKVRCADGHVTNGCPPLGINGREWVPVTGDEER